MTREANADLFFALQKAQYRDTMTDNDDIDCTAWCQPEIPLHALPRLKLDRVALASAAEDIVNQESGILQRRASCTEL